MNQNDIPSSAHKIIGMYYKSSLKPLSYSKDRQYGKDGEQEFLEYVKECYKVVIESIVSLEQRRPNAHN